MKNLLTILCLVTPMSSRTLAADSPPNPAIDGLFEDEDRDDVPGASVLVVQNGSIVYQRGYGLRTWRTTSPPTPRPTTGWRR